MIREPKHPVVHGWEGAGSPLSLLTLSFNQLVYFAIFFSCCVRNASHDSLWAKSSVYFSTNFTTTDNEWTKFSFIIFNSNFLPFASLLNCSHRIRIEHYTKSPQFYLYRDGGDFFLVLKLEFIRAFFLLFVDEFFTKNLCSLEDVELLQVHSARWLRS